MEGSSLETLADLNCNSNANTVSCTLNGISEDDSQNGRPKFYPCPDCGRKFTERAMQLHKLSCSEMDDCSCLVCKTSGTRRDWVEKYGINKFGRGLKEKNRLKGLTQRLGNVRNRNMSLKSESISFGLLDDNCQAIEKIVAQSMSSNSHTASQMNSSKENAVFNDHQYISMSDSPEQTSPSSGSSSKVLSFKPFSKSYSKYEDHDGEPCNRKLYCPVCKEHIFWDSFGTHVIQHCAVLENNYLKCPDCSKSYSKPALFLIHFYVHMLSHPSDCISCLCGHPMCADSQTNSMTEHGYAENVPYHCYICLNRFTHGQTIVNHMRLHSKERPFTCKECNRSFRQIGNLQRHMTTHRGDRPFPCPKCSRSFADPATLRNHVRVHTGETPYVCAICNRGFTQVGNLKRHMALHLTQEKMKSKDVPPPASETELEVKAEASIHGSEDGSADAPDGTRTEILSLPVPSEKSDSGEVENESPPPSTKVSKKERMKVFTCNICKKVYTWQHDLTIHYRTHTGEKPYKCELCDKRFAQSGAVRTHKLRHHTNSAIGQPRWKNKS